VICVVGDLVEDVVVRLAGAPGVAPAWGTDTDATITRSRGGSAANVAEFAARLHGASRFVGRVGDDDAGRALVARLRAAGVDPRVVHAGRTGTVVVVVHPGGERTMLSDRGASVALDAPPAGWRDGVRVLHVPAYSLAGGAIADTATRMADEAHAAGIRVAADASSTGLVAAVGAREMRARLLALRPGALLCTRGESDALGAEALVADGSLPLLVVKDGAAPTRVLSPAGTVARAVEPVAGVVDTTGAGDAFAAGFLAPWAEGAPIEACIGAAHAAAARVLRSPGATLGDAP
jgi:sugar/nucleoside kinase (ribokinase family)